MVKQGDIISVDFNPTIGSEQRGKRPAVVVSNDDFQKITKKMAIVVPITLSSRMHPFHIVLDSRTETQGKIMCEQLKTMDLNARNAKVIEKLPKNILDEVLHLIKLLF